MDFHHFEDFRKQMSISKCFNIIRKLNDKTFLCLDYDIFCLLWHKLHNNVKSKKRKKAQWRYCVRCNQNDSSSINEVVSSVCHDEIKSWAMIMSKWQVMLQ